MPKAEIYNQWKGIEKISLPKGGKKLKLIGIKQDPDPYNKGRLIIPTVMIPQTSRIFRDNKTYDIAPIESISADGQAAFSVIFFNGANGGIVKLRQGNPEHETWWKYLSLLDINKSNPDRDETVTPVFYEMDEDREAEEKVVDVKFKTEVLTICFSLKKAEKIKLAEFLGLKFSSEDVALAEIVALAEKNPAKVKEAMEGLVGAEALETQKEVSPEKPVKSTKKKVDVEKLVIAAFRSSSLVNDEDAKTVYFKEDPDVKVMQYEDKLDAKALVNLFESDENLLSKL